MDRVVVLTGAAGGLGRAMAAGLARAGYHLVLVDREKAPLDLAAGDLRRYGARIATLAWDLSDISSIARLGDAVRAFFGRVDALVNNAGLGLNTIRTDFMQRPIKFWDVDPLLVARFFAVNAVSPFLLTQCLVGDMVARGFGRVVNVTTSLDTMIRGGFATYGGTKASLEAHSAIMAADLKGTGVTVNVLVPGGPAATAMMPAETGYSRDKLIQPDVMVKPLLWLFSDEAGDVTNYRVIGVKWQSDADGRTALAGASAPIGWPQLGSQALGPR